LPKSINSNSLPKYIDTYSQQQTIRSNATCYREEFKRTSSKGKVTAQLEWRQISNRTRRVPMMDLSLLQRETETDLNTD
jgi:hypothetical protein